MCLNVHFHLFIDIDIDIFIATLAMPRPKRAHAAPDFHLLYFYIIMFIEILLPVLFALFVNDIFFFICHIDYIFASYFLRRRR